MLWVDNLRMRRFFLSLKERENMRKTRYNTQKYIGIAIFSALSFVVALVCNIIPPVANFLSLDVKDAVIAIASFIYGPISAVIIAFIAAFVEFITFSTTGWYGFVMNFASSAVFSLTASLIYKRHRNINGALLSFFAAVVATTSVMLLLNRFVTPIYLFDYLKIMPPEAATEYVISLLPTTLLPFNFAKALLNSAIAMMLYKPVALALKKTGIVEKKGSTSFNKSSVIIIISGSVALAISLVILFIIW